MSQDTSFGKLETTPAALQEKHGDDYKKSVKQILLKEIAPSAIGDPKKARQFIVHMRRFLDEALKGDGSACYFLLKDGVLCIFMPGLDPAVTNLKIKAMSTMIAKIANRIGADGQLIGGEQSKKKVVEEKLIFETSVSKSRLHLPEGEIQDEDYSNWLSKANSDLEKNSDIRRLGGDIQAMSDLMSIKYQPVYFVQNKLVSGYLCLNYKPLLLRIPERQVLQDISVLGHAIRSMYKMSETGQQFSLMFVNVDASLFKNKIARNFYNIYCRNLPRVLKKYFVLCVTGLQDHKLEGEEWDDLRALLPHCRSIMMDTGFKITNPVKFAQVNFSSFGFNVGAVRMPENAISATISEYGSYYLKEKKTSFVFNISDKDLRDKAMVAGVTYISGPTVLPALDAPGSARVVADLDAELAQHKADNPDAEDAQGSDE